MNIRAKIFGGATPAEEPILKAKKPKGAKADSLDSVRVEREVSRRGNNRAADRHRLSDETVTVRHGDRDVEVELVNLSGGGAMVTGDFDPMLWDRVDLCLGDHGTIECAVRWIRDGRIGLEFAHETRLDCSAGEVAAVLREVITRSFPDAEFPVTPHSEPKDEAHSGDEHRRAARHPLIWSGMLYHDYQSTPVRIRNISSTGAMLETSVSVRVGAEPVLQLSDAASLSATVEWRVGDQVGVRFHSPFDMRLLARSTPEVAPAEWVQPAYLHNAGNEAQSAWDPHWERLSLSELSEELEGFLKR